MRAAYVNELGPADSIRVGSLAVPRPGPTDALVAVEYSVVNPVDTFIRAGRWSTPLPMPFVVGRDLVGRVVEVEPSAQVRRGDRVWCNSLGHDGRQGPTAEMAVVPLERLYRLPPGADPVTSVAALHPAATAHLALHGRALLRAGETVLIGGAAGNVGSCAVRLAAAAGARVLATARSRDHQRLRGLGAAETLDFTDPDLADQIRSAAPEGVALWWDTSGHGDLNTAVGLTAPRGRIIVTAHGAPRPLAELWSLYTKDLSVVGFVISRAGSDELAVAAAAVNRHIEADGFAPVIHDVLPLTQARRAHELVEAGVRGRVVIEVDAAADRAG